MVYSINIQQNGKGLFIIWKSQIYSFLPLAIVPRINVLDAYTSSGQSNYVTNQSNQPSKKLKRPNRYHLIPRRQKHHKEEINTTTIIAGCDITIRANSIMFFYIAFLLLNFYVPFINTNCMPY